MRGRKYKFVWLLLSCFIISITSATANERLPWGLQGNVKSVLILSYEPYEIFGEWRKVEISNGDHYIATFDERGQLLETRFYSFWGYMALELLQIPIRENGVHQGYIFYDKRGNAIQKMKFNSISDEKIVAEMLDANGVKMHSLTKKITNGKVTKQALRLDNGYIIVELEYDKNGNLILVRLIDGGETHITRYKHLAFDEQGNWIKKMEFSNDDDEPDSLIIREITYF